MRWRAGDGVSQIEISLPGGVDSDAGLCTFHKGVPYADPDRAV